MGIWQFLPQNTTKILILLTHTCIFRQTRAVYWKYDSSNYLQIYLPQSYYSVLWMATRGYTGQLYLQPCSGIGLPVNIWRWHRWTKTIFVVNNQHLVIWQSCWESLRHRIRNTALAKCSILFLFMILLHVTFVLVTGTSHILFGAQLMDWLSSCDKVGPFWDAAFSHGNEKTHDVWPKKKKKHQKKFVVWVWMIFCLLAPCDWLAINPKWILPLQSQLG